MSHIRGLPPPPHSFEIHSIAYTTTLFFGISSYRTPWACLLPFSVNEWYEELCPNFWRSLTKFYHIIRFLLQRLKQVLRIHCKKNIIWKIFIMRKHLKKSWTSSHYRTIHLLFPKGHRPPPRCPLRHRRWCGTADTSRTIVHVVKSSDEHPACARQGFTSLRKNHKPTG